MMTYVHRSRIEYRVLGWAWIDCRNMQKHHCHLLGGAHFKQQRFGLPSRGMLSWVMLPRTQIAKQAKRDGPSVLWESLELGDFMRFYMQPFFLVWTFVGGFASQRNVTWLTKLVERCHEVRFMSWDGTDMHWMLLFYAVVLICGRWQAQVVYHDLWICVCSPACYPVDFVIFKTNSTDRQWFVRSTNI